MGILFSGHFSRHFIMSTTQNTILEGRNKSIDVKHIYPTRISDTSSNECWKMCHCGGYVNDSYKKIHLKTLTHVEWMKTVN